MLTLQVILLVVMVMSVIVVVEQALWIVNIQTNHSKISMLEREINQHKGCPNIGHCSKDEKHCCYLIKGSNTCYLEMSESEDFL